MQNLKKNEIENVSGGNLALIVITVPSGVLEAAAKVAKDMAKEASSEGSAAE